MKMREPQRHRYTDVDIMSLETKIKGVVSLALASKYLSVSQVVHDNIPNNVREFDISWADHHIGIRLLMNVDDRMIEKHIIVPRPQK